MLVKKNSVLENVMEKANALYNSGIKQRRSDARKYFQVINLVKALPYESLDVNVGADGCTYNLGDLAEIVLKYIVLNASDETFEYTKKLENGHFSKVKENDTWKSKEKGCDGYTQNGVPVEFKSLMSSASAEITCDTTIYLLVIKNGYNGIYKFTSKSIRENDLIGKRLNKIEYLNYATRLKGASAKLESLLEQ